MMKRKLVVLVSSITVAAIAGISVFISSLIMSNKEMASKYSSIEGKIDEITKKYDELNIQYEKDKEIIEELTKEKDDLQQKLSEQATSNKNNFNTENKSNNNINESKHNSLNTSANKSSVEEAKNNNEEIKNVQPIVDSKDKMVAEGRKYFLDRGIKVETGYSEMVGTNLNSGISDLEGHRVFAFTIENYDIKDNNIWFYYSPETKVGYKYEKETWTRIN